MQNYYQYLCSVNITITIYHIVEKPKIVEEPKNRTVESNKNVNLTVTAKGRDLKFKWMKHGDHSDDDITGTTSEDDDRPYCMTESVLEMAMYTFSL